MKKIVLQTVAVLGLVLTGLSAAEANQVSFVQSSVNAMTGQSITFDLVGSGFSAGPDGAAFSLSWDESVLQYVNTSIANPPWDTSFVVDSNAGTGGVIDYVFLGKSSAGGAGANFSLASFTFNVIGNAGASTYLNLADSAYGGFVAPGGVELTTNYAPGHVQVVPVPSAVWLFGTALLGLCNGGLRRRCTALVG